jgi:hypothetical protein
MNRTDEQLRNVIVDSLSLAGVDARNIGVEVVGGEVAVAGTVPTMPDLSQLAEVLVAVSDRIGCRIDCRAQLVPAPPSDSADGRGRSPFTGTSADSAHESRHQLDVD